MAAGKVLIDTSVIIDFFRKKDKTNSLFWKIIQENFCLISAITLFELYSGATTEKKKEDLKILLEYLEIIDYDNESAKLSAKIYRELKKKNKLIEFRDLFIAGTAILHKLPLATLNQKHFGRIDNLLILSEN